MYIQHTIYFIPHINLTDKSTRSHDTLIQFIVVIVDKTQHCLHYDNVVTGCICTISFKDFKFPRASKFKTI